MLRETKNQIEESYKHIKTYLNDTDDGGYELQKMCSYCEKYNGKEHDYEECHRMPCFQFYLAYEYLEWLNSSDGYLGENMQYGGFDNG